jgi:hypothetical protein
MRRTVILIFSVFFHLKLSAQDSFKWEDYLPAQQIDSIVFLAPIKKEPHILSVREKHSMTKAESKALKRFHEEIKNFHQKVYEPLTEYSEYLNIYELKKTISNINDIRDIVRLLPKDNCTLITARDKCVPVYRDCALFYAKGKIVFGIKIAFHCQYVLTTPDIQAGRCLANDEHISEIFYEWDKLGMIDDARK